MLVKNILELGQNYNNQLNMYIPKNNNVSVAKEVTENESSENLEETEKTYEKEKINQLTEEAKKFLENYKKNREVRENFMFPNKKEKRKDIFTIMDRMQKDKDYDSKEFLEDLEDANVVYEHRKELNLLYQMRNVKVDRYKEDNENDGNRFMRKLKEKIGQSDDESFKAEKVSNTEKIEENIPLENNETNLGE